jgi:hypothetical protein
MTLSGHKVEAALPKGHQTLGENLRINDPMINVGCRHSLVLVFSNKALRITPKHIVEGYRIKAVIKASLHLILF